MDEVKPEATPDPGKRRLDILRVLRDMTLETGFVPTLRAVGMASGMSVPGIKKHLDILAQLGLVTRIPNQPRCTVLTELGRRVLEDSRL